MEMLKDKFVTLTSDQRLYQLNIPLIGLTGGVASGKSSVSRKLQSYNLPLLCADKLVKEIYEEEESIFFVKTKFNKAFFQDSQKKDRIDFKILREIVFSDNDAKDLVEDFIYKRLPNKFIQAFNDLKKVNQLANYFLIYDIPLLYERKLSQFFDFIVCVYVKRSEQKKRLVERDLLSTRLAELILSQQIDIEIKKESSDYLIDNNGPQEQLAIEVDRFIKNCFI